jgi:hypothetical protein
VALKCTAPSAFISFALTFHLFTYLYHALVIFYFSYFSYRVYCFFSSPVSYHHPPPTPLVAGITEISPCLADWLRWGLGAILSWAVLELQSSQFLLPKWLELQACDTALSPSVIPFKEAQENIFENER